MPGTLRSREGSGIGEKIEGRKDKGKMGHEYNNLMKFTDFIQHLTQTLNNYEDTDLEHFFQILNDVIKMCPYEECDIIELLDNYKLKTFLKDSLTAIKQKTANDIRVVLNAVNNKLKYDKNNTKLNKLIDIINSLYNNDFIETFKAILSDVHEYRFKKNNDFVDLKHIISEAIKYVLIYHYNELNDNTRAKLKTRLENYFNSIKSHTVSQTLKEFISHNNSSATQKPRIETTRAKVPEKYTEDESSGEVYTTITTNKIHSSSSSISTIRQSTLYAVKRNSVTIRKDINKKFTQSTEDTNDNTNVKINDTKKPTNKFVESGVETNFEAVRELNQENKDSSKTNTSTNNTKISPVNKPGQNVINITRRINYTDFDAAQLTSSAETSSAEGLSIEMFE